MLCPKCSSAMEIRVDIIGGCHCYGQEGRCYCDSADVKAYWECRGAIPSTGKRPRQIPCRHQVPIYELGDQYAIARWLNKNYEGRFMAACREALDEPV